jgi:hypothetical protein
VAGTCVDGAAALACQATSVARLPVDPGQPFELASDGARLYWTDTASGAIRSAKLDGTAPATILTGRPGLSGLAADATYVYFSDVAQKSVSRIALSGGTLAEIIATGQRAPRFLASDGDRLVWTNQGTGRNDGAVRQYTKSTGQIDALADGQGGPWTIAVIGGTVYWSDVAAGSVLGRASPSAALQTVASGLVHPAVVTAGAQPYFLSADGRLFGFDAAASTVAPRAIGAGGEFSLAAREPSLFWTNGVRQTVTQQLSPAELPSTIWRRSGTGAPRVIRLLAGNVLFSVAAPSGPGSIFAFAPDPAVSVPQGSPVCPPGGQGASCDLTAGSVLPLLECVVEAADHSLTAHFGYTNQDRVAHRVGAGRENHVDSGDGDACQPATFAAGTHHDVFAVGFVDEVSWIVGQRSVTASHSAARCAAGSVRNLEVSP